MGWGSLERTGGTGHLGKNIWDRASETGHLGQDFCDRTTKTEQPRGMSPRTGQPGHDKIQKTYIFAKIPEFYENVSENEN
jgi:hypothetical protein